MMRQTHRHGDRVTGDELEPRISERVGDVMPCQTQADDSPASIVPARQRSDDARYRDYNERDKSLPVRRNTVVPVEWATQPKGTHYEPHS
jgi:hypothetical protein